MRILGFVLGSVIWFWVVYSLTMALAQAIKTGIASIYVEKYIYHQQPIKFLLTVLVQFIFWLGMVGWCLNGVWNLLIKLAD